MSTQHSADVPPLFTQISRYSGSNSAEPQYYHLLLEVDPVVVAGLDEGLLVGAGRVVHHPPTDLAGDLDGVAQRQHLQEIPDGGLLLQVCAWFNYTEALDVYAKLCLEVYAAFKIYN